MSKLRANTGTIQNFSIQVAIPWGWVAVPCTSSACVQTAPRWALESVGTGRTPSLSVHIHLRVKEYKSGEGKAELDEGVLAPARESV